MYIQGLYHVVAVLRENLAAKHAFRARASLLPTRLAVSGIQQSGKTVQIVVVVRDAVFIIVLQKLFHHAPGNGVGGVHGDVVEKEIVRAVHRKIAGLLFAHAFAVLRNGNVVVLAENALVDGAGVRVEGKRGEIYAVEIFGAEIRFERSWREQLFPCPGDGGL